MADEKGEKQNNDTFKWIVGSLIALLAAGSGIVALLTYFRPPQNNNYSQVQTDPRPNGVSEKPDNSSHQINSSKSSKNNESPVNNKPESKNDVTKIECNVAGTVYDGDKNPMPNVEILLIDENKKETSLTRTGDGGKFEANCSEISQEHFPQKLEVKGDVWHWDYTAMIPRGGQKSINVYVPRYILDEAAKTRIKTTIVK